MITTKETIYISPGDTVFTKEQKRLWTVLGSCISIILYHPETRYTGMSHAQLPEYAPCVDACAGDCPVVCGENKKGENPLRYVNCSLKYLLNLFNRKGITGDMLEARLYGGSSLIQYSGQKIGDANVMVARGLIVHYALNLVHHDVGGEKGRTVQFYTDTAKVDVKQQKGFIFEKSKVVRYVPPVIVPVN